MLKFLSHAALLIFAVLHAPFNASASTIYIGGKQISSIDTISKSDILAGYFDSTHTIGINKSNDYGFIGSSNGSADSGFDDDFFRVNIVDFLLENRAGQYNYQNDTYFDNNTYTLIDNFPGTWRAAGITATIITEIAGYQDFNTLNYYTANKDGTISYSDSSTLIFKGKDSSLATSNTLLHSTQTIGLYLGVPTTNNKYFTDALRNIDEEIHSAVFRVGNSNTYIIGFEDLRLSYSDHDYQDMIVSATMSPIPNPEPGTLLLTGLGVAGASFMFRRKAVKAL